MTTFTTSFQAPHASQSVPNRLTNRRSLIKFIATSPLLIRSGAVFSQNSPSFDHRYTAFDALLKQHVRWLPDQKQSRVDYAGLAKQDAAL